MTSACLAAGLAGLSLLWAGPLPVRESSDPPVYADQAAYETTVQVRFLGVSGFLIRRGAEVVLTAPLYSTPGIFRVLSEKAPVILPRTDRIARFHPDVEDVQAILVGHAHYDHLMDVPYVWERTPGATIFGSLTTRNILLGYRGRGPGIAGFPEHVPTIDPQRVVALDDPGDPLHFVVDSRTWTGPAPDCRAEHACPSIPRQEGGFVRVGRRIRIRAILARHPPQFLKYHQAPCCIRSPRETPPASIDEYLEGNVLAFLVDFLDDRQRVAYRVYFQDVPADGTIGQVAPELIEERAVDLALLCAGNSSAVEDPEKIVANLRPSAVIIGHWEDFFRPQDRPYAEAPFQKVGRFYGRVRRELDRLPGPRRPLYLPKPGVLMTFPVPGSAVEGVVDSGSSP